MPVFAAFCRLKEKLIVFSAKIPYNDNTASARTVPQEEFAGAKRTEISLAGIGYWECGCGTKKQHQHVQYPKRNLRERSGRKFLLPIMGTGSADAGLEIGGQENVSDE